MSLRTTSEKLFEDYCTRNSLRFRRVSTGTTRTPDYDVFFSRRKVVVEVKEITPNSAERVAKAALANGKPVVVTITPGQRIRGKISDSVPQIKSRTKHRFPGLLVLYEEGPLPRHVDEYQIRVAMFGFESVVIAVPNDPRQSPYSVGRKYGRGRKMTPDHSTSVSAIGVLSASSGNIGLAIYHNPHAKIPLPPELVAQYDIPQFKLADAPHDEIAHWEMIV